MITRPLRSPKHAIDCLAAIHGTAKTITSASSIELFNDAAATS